MAQPSTAWTVFISHSGTDTWIAKQIAREIEAHGATTFLDEANISIGEDFEERILTALDRASELLVLLTPWSLQRAYIWAEIGAAWGRRIPIIGVLYGLTADDIQADTSVPNLLKRRDLVELNDIESYFHQLSQRIQ